MIQHRHHVPGRALRKLLAGLRSPLDSLDAEMILIREINGCEFCWFLIADELAGVLRAEIRARIAEHPGTTVDGYIRYCEQRLLEQLDHADDDEDDAA